MTHYYTFGFVLIFLKNKETRFSSEEDSLVKKQRRHATTWCLFQSSGRLLKDIKEHLFILTKKPKTKRKKISL